MDGDDARSERQIAVAHHRHGVVARREHALVDDVREHVLEGRKEMFYLTTHSTHFIYGYLASDIWLRTSLIVRKETRCHHIGYSFRLTARVLLHAPSQTG